MPYWRLYYHVVWATKDREPLITRALEDALFEYVRGKGIALGGKVYAVGGIEDHVHVAVSIPPRLAISTYVGQLKGASSHWVNHVFQLGAGFDWQEGFGVFSFSHTGLAGVAEYIARQREHHQTGQTIPALERIEFEDLGP